MRLQNIVPGVPRPAIQEKVTKISTISLLMNEVHQRAYLASASKLAQTDRVLWVNSSLAALATEIPPQASMRALLHTPCF